ncbi:MAG: hypothetical protein EAY75_06730 [Bacteroidetes bacterium]|nr:MAG: hypothetical protein EAY75_06730 [Bacteroidota bacterium]
MTKVRTQYLPVWLNTALVLNVLLTLWFIFYRQLSLPVVLQSGGRLHPLLLHFPATLWVLLAVWLLFLKNITDVPTHRGIALRMLDVLAVATPVTAITGLWLGSEAGYEEGVNNHRIAGVALSWFSLLVYATAHLWMAKRKWLWAVCAGSLAGVTITGHGGASLTHGADFVWEPLLQKKAEGLPALNEALVFAHGIQPVLDSKCVSCHNEAKTKGGLLMSTVAGLLKGGEHGALWDSTNPSLSLILQRLHLPLQNKEHMPPKGKVQPSEEDIRLISEWVEAGSSFTQRFSDLPDTSWLRQWAVAKFQPQASNLASVKYPAVDAGTVAKLNNPNRLVQPLAVGVSGLSVRFFNRHSFKSSSLNELEPVYASVAELNLTEMPITADDVQTIARMSNLQVLHLNQTGLAGAALKPLGGLKHLSRLSLNGVALKPAQLEWIKETPLLTAISVGNTGLAEVELAALAKKYPKLQWQVGRNMDTVLLTLNKPIIDHKLFILQQPLTLNLRHVIKDADIRYTLDGSEPDSINSPKYGGKVVINKSLTVKARAFKAGWKGSEIAEVSFYKRQYIPSKAELLLAANPNYAGRGGLSLIDSLQSEKNFKSGRWLAFRETGMDANLYFENEVLVSSVTFGSIVEVASYIMPPKKLEVWGSADGKSFKLLGTTIPTQPTQTEPGKLTAFQVNFKETPVRVLKLKAQTVNPLPAWHPGKGDKGWFFVDEVFVN